MKCFLIFVLVLSCFLLNHDDAFCSEDYYIDGNPILLYKVINWWYDCLPKESKQLCGHLIKCESNGDARVEYIEAEKKLKLKIKGGFADLLSISKPCGQSFGPSYLKCTWLNKKYFGTGEAVDIPNESPLINDFIIHNVGKYHGRLIYSIEKYMVFELEGVIGGLLNGKIALHQAGNFIKDWPAADHGRGNGFPVSLKIINSNTKEALANYSVITE